MSKTNTYFKSRIIFVSPKTYQSICKYFRKHKNCEIIHNWHIKPDSFESSWQGKDLWCGWRKNLQIGYTDGVRSCTAGIIANEGNCAPLFWHIENTPENHLYLKELKNSMKGTNAIIVGSKSCFEYSQAIFEKFKKYAKQKNKHLTFFQDLKVNWQANLAYHIKKDTLFLCVNEIKGKEYVNSLKKLQQIFSKIRISPNDKLIFANPIKQFFLRHIKP